MTSDPARYESKTEDRREAMDRAWAAYCAAKRAFEESQRRDAEWFDAVMGARDDE